MHRMSLFSCSITKRDCFDRQGHQRRRVAVKHGDAGEAATLMKIPVITTASEPNGTNGPLMPEIHQFAPHAVYVPRKGEVNAWDNELFVKTVRDTGRRRSSWRASGPASV